VAQLTAGVTAFAKGVAAATTGAVLRKRVPPAPLLAGRETTSAVAPME
jgi:hypothetical protein